MDKKTIIDQVIIPIEDAGFEAYFVGGCVRDEVVGKEPHDYDIVTSARPDDLHQIFDKFVDINSEAFGIVVVNVDGENVEIATMRKDRECDGRHTSIEFTSSIEEDAKRRDFTINAMYQDKNGKIIDPLGGREDIKNGVLKFVGNPEDRLREDNLRLLRLFRFAASKKGASGKLSLEGLDKIKVIAKDPTFIKSFNSRVSPERVGKEMRQIIAGYNAPEIVSLMVDIFGDNYNYVFPKELARLRDQKCNMKYHTSPTNLAHSLRVFSEMCDQTSDFVPRAAALFHDLGKLTTQAEDFSAHGHEEVSADICQTFLKESWKLTVKEVNSISHLVRHHMEMHQLGYSKHPIKIWRFIQSVDFENLLKLLKADCADVPSAYDDFGTLMSVKNLDFFRETPFPNDISGKDLMGVVSPGKYFSRGLEVANDFVARAIIKSLETGDSSYNKSTILKQAAEAVKQLRKNDKSQ